MSLWWFDQLADLVPHHVVSTDVPEAVRGRAVVCERLEMFPVECVARGYLTGSGLLDYRATGEVCGIPLPAGLRTAAGSPSRSSRPPPRPRSATTTRTSSTTRSSATVGDRGRRAAARPDPGGLRPGRGDRPRPRDHPGRHQARVRRAAGRHHVLGDEVLTPDSSRFWPADEWQPGRAQPSYDKQIVRDWLLSAGVRLGPLVRRGAAAAAAGGRRAHPRAGTSRPTSGSPAHGDAGRTSGPVAIASRARRRRGRRRAGTRVRRAVAGRASADRRVDLDGPDSERGRRGAVEPARQPVPAWHSPDLKAAVEQLGPRCRRSAAPAAAGELRSGELRRRWGPREGQALPVARRSGRPDRDLATTGCAVPSRWRGLERGCWRRARALARPGGLPALDAARLSRSTDPRPRVAARRGSGRAGDASLAGRRLRRAGDVREGRRHPAAHRRTSTVTMRRPGRGLSDRVTPESVTTAT